MKKLFCLILIAASSSLFAGDVLKISEPSSEPEAKSGKKKFCKKRKMMVMKKFDKDGNGELSEAEKKEMKAHMEKRRAAMLAKFDKDKDGELSAEERKAAFSEMGPRKGKKCNKSKGETKKGDDNAI